MTHLEIDVAQHMLFGVALNALRPVQKGHFQPCSLFGGQPKHLGNVVNLQYHWTFVNSCLLSHYNLSHGLEHLCEFGAVLAEHVNSQPQDERR